MTPLLAVLQTPGYIWPATIRLLLQRGANIAARDPDGRTCLHWAFYGFRYPENEALFHRRLQASLILLVEAGADIHAVDKDNSSISEYAIKDKHWEIWEAVLRDCGKDMGQVGVKMREKGYSLPGDPDYQEYACRCGSEIESDSEYSELDTSEEEEDDRFSAEGDAQHDIHHPEACDETNDFRDGSESDSDCSMGGAELSFGAL
jgi:hypothetical protein